MNKRDMIDMALRNLWKRRLRTALTVLGVVIGTASIVVMVSIGIGMKKGFASQLENWGSLQVIDVYPSGGMEYDKETGNVVIPDNTQNNNGNVAIPNGNNNGNNNGVVSIP